MSQQLRFGEVPSNWDIALVFPSRGLVYGISEVQGKSLWDCNEYLQVFVGVIETHRLLVE